MAARSGILLGQDEEYRGPSPVDGAPRFTMTCPRCGTRRMRKAYSWRFDPNAGKLSFLSFRCGYPTCEVNLQVRKSIEAPDFTSKVPTTDDRAKAATIPRGPLPPGAYTPDQYQIMLDDEENIIGMKYLVEGRWITHKYPRGQRHG